MSAENDHNCGFLGFKSALSLYHLLDQLIRRGRLGSSKMADCLV